MCFSILRIHLLEKTKHHIKISSLDKIGEISDFAEYVLKKHEEMILQKGMEKLVSDSKAFDFLGDEEELYFIEDLKEKY